jgi:hypothetical protein
MGVVITRLVTGEPVLFKWEDAGELERNHQKAWVSRFEIFDPTTGKTQVEESVTHIPQEGCQDPIKLRESVDMHFLLKKNIDVEHLLKAMNDELERESQKYSLTR